MQKTSISARDRFLIGLLAGYVGFGLACFIDSDDNNSDSNNSSNNSANNGNNNTTNNNSGGVINVQGSVKTNTTWKGKVIVNGDVSVPKDVALTVEAGTEIVMCADCFLDLGYFNDAATINFNGTAEKPIIIRGEQSLAGYWKGMRVGEKVTSNSGFKYVQIKDAGAGETPALELERGILIDHVTVENAGFDAIHAANFKEGSTDLTVKDAKGYPVVLTEDTALYNFPANDALAGEKGMVALTFNRLNGTGTIRSLSVPYYLTNSLASTKDSVITITEGATFNVAVDQSVDFGYFNDSTTLELRGTAEKPVVFQGIDPAPGAWKGIRFNETLRSTSKIEHLVVRHGGGSDGDYGAIINESDALFKNITVESTKGPGIVVTSEARFKEGSGEITVKGSTQRPIAIHAEALLSLPQSCDFSDNADPRVEITGNRIDGTGTLYDYGVPFLADNGLALVKDTDLTVEAGVHIEFGIDQNLSLGYFNDSTKFAFNGTAEKPIVLTGVDQGKGSWDGVFVNAETKTGSSFSYVQFSYGGKDGGANLTTEKDLDIKNCSFENSAGYGLILKSGAVAKKADYMSANTFSGNTQGDISE